MSICDSMTKIPLPRYLYGRNEEILHIFDNASGWDYKPEGWRHYFDHNPVVTAELDIIIQKCPSMISRKDVRDFARQSRSGGYEELRRFFLACMIWGWGRGGKYKEGFRNTEAALSDSRLKETLEKSVERIRNAQIKEAYEGFDLKGCGDAFFTKFFYFVGQEWGLKPLPLILDSRVRSLLRFLREQEGWDELIFANANGYLQYICSMDGWAKELGCPADKMEYFMFKEAKKIRKNTKGEAGESRRKEEQGINEEQEGGKMDNDTERLPLTDASTFARGRGYNSEADYIDSILRIGGASTLKRALYMKLFQKKRSWDEFKKRHWQNGDKPDGEKRVKEYEKLSTEFLKYLKDVATGRRPHDELKLGEGGPSGQAQTGNIQPNTEEIEQLKNEATQMGIDVSTIVQLRILERLNQLHKD